MADIVEWLDTDSVGIDAIDQDHKHLVLLANALLKSAFEGDKDKYLVQGMAELIVFTQDHFSREEKYLAQVKTVDLAAHVAQHEKIVDELFEMNEKLRAGDLDIVAMSTFLMDWLYAHMRGSDQKAFNSLDEAAGS